jgi:hypothetical protein
MEDVMVRKIAVAIILIASLSVPIFPMGDTVRVSYTITPDVSVASIYMELVLQASGHDRELVSFLRTHDRAMFNRLAGVIDSLVSKSYDPNDIIRYVRLYGGSKHELVYVRLLLTIMTNRWLGLRTPFEVTMAFDNEGYLEHLECRGFATLDDGFVLTRPFLMKKKIHRSALKELKI